MTGQARLRRLALPFAGRARELQAVAACLAGLRAGQGGAILVSGEPGIGKTSLAGQVQSHAADLGVPVVWGSCAEDEGAPPLWPWRQILAAAARPAPGRALRDQANRILPPLAGRPADSGHRGANSRSTKSRSREVAKSHELCRQV